MTEKNTVVKSDVVLIGAGIMSATLGSIIKYLQPGWSINLFERLDAAAAESSDPWNNAGTGHSALCELNYTPRAKDGSVDITKAINVNEQFQISRQFWSFGLENGLLSNPSDFINPIPHASFVHGTDNVDYLRRRYDSLSNNPLFKGMEFTSDFDVFAEKFPLMTRGRDVGGAFGMSYSDGGTDVDFGSLTKQLLNYLGQTATIHYGSEVTNVSRATDGTWDLTVKNRRMGQARKVNARFVFVGAGGGALHLLQKSGIKEAKGFGGFPVSGEFLRCNNSDVIAQHSAKVYGQASVGAPPMSVPHLDTRVINGKKGLLFGPYAGFSPKFLKQGSYTDLFTSVKPGNLVPMLSVGAKEMALTRYLIDQLRASLADKVDGLRDFVPSANGKDWDLITAGQRVQVIRPKGSGGVLEFGTAVITSEDGTLGGLLGASPGASTAVPAMLDVLQKCFPKHFAEWMPHLETMIPSYGHKLSANEHLFDQVWEWTNRVLDLNRKPGEPAAPAIASHT